MISRREIPSPSSWHRQDKLRGFNNFFHKRLPIVLQRAVPEKALKEIRFNYVRGLPLQLDCLTFIFTNEGDKFLKKLWCCVGGRKQQGNLLLATELITLIGHRKAEVSSPLSFALLRIVNSVDNTEISCIFLANHCDVGTHLLTIAFVMCKRASQASREAHIRLRRILESKPPEPRLPVAVIVIDHEGNSTTEGKLLGLRETLLAITICFFFCSISAGRNLKSLVPAAYSSFFFLIQKYFFSDICLPVQCWSLINHFTAT